MKITPNLSMPWRVLYILAGTAVSLSPLLWTMPTATAVLLAVAGAFTVISGAVGW